MLKRCTLCKKLKKYNQDKSYHLFPSDEKERRQWFSAIGRTYRDEGRLFLCSDHFSSDDFLIRKSDKSIIVRKGAIPKIASKSVQEEETNGRSLDFKQEADNMLITCITEEPRKPVNNSPAEDPSPESTVTISPSEAVIEVDCEMKGLNVKNEDTKEIQNIPDLSMNSKENTDIEETTLPESNKVSASYRDAIQSLTNLKLANYKMIQQKKKILKLVKQQQRLKNKVQYMHLLWSYLTKNNFVRVSVTGEYNSLPRNTSISGDEEDL
ncbi:hypothetical protein NQ315_009447 [Exocentrus adspersus]|uniref:THAP-type domain-containing protein n=1 Tax=Exocentrus adspersus TaxID=1586481 RepID=A0AAV8WGC0_9CUCU|nr:hypothetical protein NQ315_009447 [Exocentrus adspersus]